MSQTKKAIFNWSGGKDSSLALYHILKNKSYTIGSLLSTINKQHDRLSMHGVRRSLIEEQARSLKIPLTTVMLPDQPDMETYNEAMSGVMESFREQGYTHSVFGDIFLEDLREYREEQSRKAGFETVFPIWKRDTQELMNEFLDLGFKAISVCVKADMLEKDFVGRIIDRDFVDALPKEVDPCGENGEFHTFVFDGPIFDNPVAFETGEKIYRKYDAPDSEEGMGFWFCDLIPE